MHIQHSPQNEAFSLSANEAASHSDIFGQLHFAKCIKSGFLGACDDWLVFLDRF